MGLHSYLPSDQPWPVSFYDSVVDIEERLLHFPRQAALHAWRLFRVRTEGKRVVLSSPMYHDDTTGLTPLWPSLEAEAACPVKLHGCFMIATAFR
jgi:hypothetical protein